MRPLKAPRRPLGGGAAPLGRPLLARMSPVINPPYSGAKNSSLKDGSYGFEGPLGGA